MSRIIARVLSVYDSPDNDYITVRCVGGWIVRVGRKAAPSLMGARIMAAMQVKRMRRER